MKEKLIYDTTTPVDSDNVGAYMKSASGALITSSTDGAKERLDVSVGLDPADADQFGIYAEDSAHASGDLGQFVLGIRQDADVSPVSADGDYHPLVFDQDGRLKVSADLEVTSDYAYAEDSASASGDIGASVLAVRQDTLASSTSTDGDYGWFKQTALGELYTHDVNANASLDVIETEIVALSHLEDVAHVSGDAGIMSLAVRNDANTSLVGTDGDYAPLQVSAVGRLKVDATVTTNFEKAEDAAHVSGDVGAYILSVRQDVLASSTSADGDYQSVKTDALGRTWMTETHQTSASTAVTVANTATDLVASDLTNRRRILIQNVDNTRAAFIGNAAVTASTGIRLSPGSSIELMVGPSVDLHGITSAGTADLRVLELA